MSVFKFEITSRTTGPNGPIEARIITLGFADTRPYKEAFERDSTSDDDYYECHPYLGDDEPCLIFPSLSHSK